MGVPAIRKRVAKFIEGESSHGAGGGGELELTRLLSIERDGYPSHPSKIYLTAGASTGVSNLMQILISSPSEIGRAHV